LLPKTWSKCQRPIERRWRQSASSSTLKRTATTLPRKKQNVGGSGVNNPVRKSPLSTTKSYTTSNKYICTPNHCSISPMRPNATAQVWPSQHRESRLLKLINYCCLCVRYHRNRGLYCVNSATTSAPHNVPTLQHDCAFAKTAGTIILALSDFCHTDKCDGTVSRAARVVLSHAGGVGNPGGARNETCASSRAVAKPTNQPTGAELILARLAVAVAY
jgi:hypothetical protein